MQRRLLVALATLFCACDPTIKVVAPPSGQLVALFDPSTTPPTVPTPNDLATDPATGLLNIPVPATAAGPDLDFYAYLDTLDGYPTSATANEVFSAALSVDSVTADTVRIYDVISPTMLTKLTLTPVYSDIPDAGQISINPPATGWTAGHTYAVAIIGGANGVKGALSETVIGSPTWALVRSANSLVTGCTDLTSSSCQSATALIPSSVTDAAGRQADQAAKAVQLEALRLKYAPILAQLGTEQVARTDVAIAWTFKIDDLAQVAFNPPTSVPVPNDLAINPATGKVTVPIDPTYSAAYQEFIVDYLDTLDGFPTASVASVGIVAGDVDPASITPANVIAISLTGQALTGPVDVTYSSTTKQLSIAPPGGSWGKANHIAIAVIGGIADGGVDAIGGAPVTASPVWALVRSASPLVDCTIDCTNPAAPVVPTPCNVLLTAAPLPLPEAAGLECLREIYSPVLDAFEAAGAPRATVDIAWTFAIDTLPEMTFDPSSSVIPFPNDILRSTGANAHLELPIPDGGPALQVSLLSALDNGGLIDGWSLTAPAVSESSDSLGALDVGSIDPATLDAGTGFVPLAGPATPPDVFTCLNCASSPMADGGLQTTPQQLQFVPRHPLTEQSTYGAYVTTSLQDTNGNPVQPSATFALVRLLNPICDTATMTSLVPIVSDLQACGTATSPGLEQLRLGLKPMIDGLEPLGVTRKNLALAWAYTTQTTVTQLSQLHDSVANLAALNTLPFPTTLSSIFPVPTAAVMPTPLPCSSAPAAGFPACAMATNVFMGTLTLPFALTGPGQVLLPPNHWVPQKALFLLTVPAGAAPAGGWPVVLFGHGLGGNRLQMLAIANTFASAGLATIAVDVVWHGDRSTCAGSAVALAGSIPNATDDYACASPAANHTPDPVHAMCDETTGRCVARPAAGLTAAACDTASPTMGDALCISMNQGFCIPTSASVTAGNCEGADFARGSDGAPLISAWNFLNLNNLFAARDNFRHYTLDLAQVVQVVKNAAFSPTVQAAGGPKIDATTLAYAGMSLGGFNGSLFCSVDSDVKNVALNVPGSDQSTVLLVSPAFESERDAFLGQLATIGLVPGTPQFDDLFVLIKTIFDPADPQNYLLTGVNLAAQPNRKVYISWIANDFVVPNITTEELINEATSGAKQPIIEQVNPSFTTLPPANRHGYLLDYTDPTTTLTAQGRVATFIVTGSP